MARGIERGGIKFHPEEATTSNNDFSVLDYSDRKRILTRFASGFGLLAIPSQLCAHTIESAVKFGPFCTA